MDGSYTFVPENVHQKYVTTYALHALVKNQPEKKMSHPLILTRIGFQKWSVAAIVYINIIYKLCISRKFDQTRFLNTHNTGGIHR